MTSIYLFDGVNIMLKMSDNDSVTILIFTYLSLLLKCNPTYQVVLSYQ